MDIDTLNRFLIVQITKLFKDIKNKTFNHIENKY